MRFTWFWTFWHWSKESFRTGALLRGPLQGIGGHWDEWFRHEASDTDLQAIAETGRTETTQREFIAWLYRHWSRETHPTHRRLIPRYILGQLAPVAPFRDWRAFAKYRDGYGIGGVAAIVLAEGSAGQREDVRPVEGMVLPAGIGPKIVSEGFAIQAADLEVPRQAALSLLRGKGLLYVLALWILGGRRPHPRAFRATLGLGWVTAGGLMLYLLVGPEPSDRLPQLALALVGIWISLVAIEFTIAALQTLRAWRQGKVLAARLDQGQTRLRMNGGLTIKGGSAGLSFCLNTLLAVHRANPHLPRRSWIWSQFFHRMRAEGPSWAATGAIDADGFLGPVVIEPKLRACLQSNGIRHLVTPRQPNPGRRSIARLVDAAPPTARNARPARPGGAVPRWGFAAEPSSLALHPCRHLSQVMIALGDLKCVRQQTLTALAVMVSGVMLWAIPDLARILAPPAAPQVVAPSSPSPYHLWVSLDTDHPNAFQVVLESRYWSNRRAKVVRYDGANASVRAEIALRRIGEPDVGDSEDGTLWIERRRHFLTREFAPGERVGRYSVAYLNGLAHE